MEEELKRQKSSQISPTTTKIWYSLIRGGKLDNIKEGKEVKKLGEERGITW